MAEKDNAPGQDSLRYRLGSHRSFLERMLRQLPMEVLPDGPHEGARPLTALTARRADDPAVALLDAWATVADVLCFYQERIANEGYLRTATERESLVLLSQAIGYELGPGVAAGTHLAFTADDSAADTSPALIPKGTRVQNIPAPGKLPQTFETVEDLEAIAELNALRPQLTRAQELRIADGKLYVAGPNGEASAATRIYFKGTDTNLKAGDLLLVALAGDDESFATLPVKVRRAAPESAQDRTRVEIEMPRETRTPPRRPKAAPSLTHGILQRLQFNREAVRRLVERRAWLHRDLSAFLRMQRWRAKDLLKHVAAVRAPELPVPQEGIFALRARLGFFGHNAPRWETLPKPENTRGTDPYKRGWDGANARTVWTNSQGDALSGAHVYLERAVPEVGSDSWAVFETSAGYSRVYRVSATTQTTLVDYALSGNVSGLSLREADGSELPDDRTAAVYPGARFGVRGSTAFVRSERLELADLPLEDDLPKGVSRLTLDSLVLGLREGQAIALSGEQADAEGVQRSEILTIDEIVHDEGLTTLHLRERLRFGYVRGSVRICGNVVRATHGETVKEILGSGDGTATHQEFRLKRGPLTFVSTATAKGAASTLEVRVNDVQWPEADSFTDADERTEAFTLRTDGSGHGVVTFGDGRRGTRLPTGVENVTATYRVGLGPDGEVDEGTLTLLQTRPLGVREVTNPLPSTGAAPPETLREAQTNAPLSVCTLGRIVSLQDYGDFASAFPGIGKARAVSLWNGARRVAHLTVATAGGDPVDPASELYKNLLRAIEAVRGSPLPVLIDGFELLLFNITAKVASDNRHRAPEVLHRVAKALESFFSFDRRGFGQPVTASEVVTRIQQVNGVVACDLDQLYFATDAPALHPHLLAAPARWREGAIQPAQLLLLNPLGVTLLEMPV